MPLSFQTSPDGLSRAYDLAENPNQMSTKEAFASTLGKVAEQRDGDRAKMRVYNILDMDLVPVNPRALMREVPFSNLLNASYTFDRMAHEFVIPEYVRGKAAEGVGGAAGLTVDNLMIAPGDRVAKVRELMVKLLTSPYADFETNGHEYYGLLASLFNGNDDMKTGRPK